MSFGRDRLAGAGQRRLQRVPRQAGALHPHGELGHPGERLRACPSAFRSAAPSRRPVTSFWNSSASAMASARVFPLTAAVISEAEAFEMAQPVALEAHVLDVSPSTSTQTVRWSPQSGLCPSAWRAGGGSSRKFLGVLLWSRMTLWYSSSRSRHHAEDLPRTVQTRAPARRFPRGCCRRRTRPGPWRAPRSARITGWAQWCPARMATPSASSTVPRSCGCTPSSTKESTPAFSRAVPTSRTPGTALTRSVAQREQRPLPGADRVEPDAAHVVAARRRARSPRR